MKNRTITLVCFLALFFCLGSCKVYRDVENLKPSYSKEEKAGEFVSESLERLVVGDKIIVKTKSGRAYSMHYKRVQSPNLIGDVWLLNGNKINPIKTVEIPIDEIEEVSVKRPSSALKVSLILVVVFGFAIFIAQALAIGSAF